MIRTVSTFGHTVPWLVIFGALGACGRGSVATWDLDLSSIHETEGPDLGVGGSIAEDDEHTASSTGSEPRPAAPPRPPSDSPRGNNTTSFDEGSDDFGEHADPEDPRRPPDRPTPRGSGTTTLSLHGDGTTGSRGDMGTAVGTGPLIPDQGSVTDASPDMPTGTETGADDGVPPPPVVRTLEYPDIDIPTPEGLHCARLQWLPKNVTIAALSTDGSTVLGTLPSEPHSNPFFRRAFFQRDLHAELAALSTEGIDITDDGQTMLLRRHNVDNTEDIYRWQPPQQPELMMEDATGVAISGDGRTVVGNLPASIEFGGNERILGRAFRWTEGEEVELLPYWPNPTSTFLTEEPWSPIASSADALHIAGHRYQYFRCTLCEPVPNLLWAEDTGLYPDDLFSVSDVSADGSAVVGYLSGYLRPAQVMLWRPGLGEPELLDLEGFEIDRELDPNREPYPSGLVPYPIRPKAISEDGAVVLAGTAIWRESEAPMRVVDVLEDHCVDPDALIPYGAWYGIELSLTAHTLVGCVRAPHDGRLIDQCWIASNVSF